MTATGLVGPRAATTSFEAGARIVIRSLLVLIVVTSMGGITPALVPEQYGQLQQVAALGLWCVVIAVSVFVAPIRRFEFTVDLLAIVAFYVFAVLSAFWSGLSAPTFMKAAAMSITTFGAFRLVTRIDIDDIVGAATLALFLLIGVSVLFALFVPSIGVNDSWMHGGQWQGIFASKQALGIISAYLILFASYRKITGGGWPAFVLVLVVALAGVVGSGSRGGAALAVAACLVLYLCSRSIGLMKVFTFGPLALTAVACVMLSYLYTTGRDSFELFGTSVDFTERTFIWQYALKHFDNAPLFGYGLNGFWTVNSIYDYFEQNHGWVLDNYHNGYLAILMETGLFGFLMFLAVTSLVTVRLLFTISRRAMLRSHCMIIIVFMMLSYQINVTETNFLRSTSFMSILLIMFQLAVCSVPAGRTSVLGNARERPAC